MTTARAVTEAVPQGRVDAAIRNAAARSGVDFNYLYHQARLESGFNPNAKASSSSATGLYQFLDQTWLAMIDKHGAQNGLGWAADAVQRGGNGRYFVSDPAMRRQIMELRRNPEAASAMGAAYASDNRAHLERRLGRPMQAVDLYMAHFLGAGGATQFLRAHDTTPGASAAAAFPQAARANRNIFFKRDGSPRSFTEVRNMMAAKLTIGGRTMTASAGSAQAPAPMPAAAPMIDPAQQFGALDAAGTNPMTSLSPRYARLAYLMLAELGA
jgi:hypothetical protein